MRILMDTHIFLWWLSEPDQLKPKELESISDPEHTVFLSAVVGWEIAIKKSLGKLEFDGDLIKIADRNQFEILPISLQHTQFLEKLEDHHKDPFDRLLLAQAKTENLVFATHDRLVRKYDVQFL